MLDVIQPRRLYRTSLVYPGKMGAIGALLAIVSVAAFANPRFSTLAPGTLRIGTYFLNPPFEYVSKGEKVGFEVDLMIEIARRLGLAPVFVNTQWETILRETEEGRYDCIVGGITITPNRERILAWSIPYMTTTLSLVVNRAKTPAIRTIADLKNASVGVQAAIVRIAGVRSEEHTSELQSRQYLVCRL